MFELLFSIFGVTLVVALAFIYSTLTWGFVTYKFWYWFILPVFPVLPELTFIQCIGLYAFMCLFHNQTQPIIKKEYRDDKLQNISAISAPIVAFVIGWLIHVLIIR